MAYITREDARLAIVNKVQSLATTWTDWPLLVNFDNLQTVDPSQQSNPYLDVTIVYEDGYQINLGPASEHRVIGQILLEAYAKENTGTSGMNKILDHFYRGLHMTDAMPPVRTYAARYGSKPVFKGWVAQAAIIPFWYDTL